jgi:hypothetical protein
MKKFEPVEVGQVQPLLYEVRVIPPVKSVILSNFPKTLRSDLKVPLITGAHLKRPGNEESEKLIGCRDENSDSKVILVEDMNSHC